ncbi:hypothetical protein VNI00_007449 [Paramarasmius palmivorus]|uniref:Mannose-6-phosphate isomerase n=1 Tax=Paramarasmius palmivorus TaxID=297713 RepID=A0AAW0D4X1_9AGAR
MLTPAFIRPSCPVQPYPYGKKGSKSLAAQFAVATPENEFHIDENQPYGEIWMGDHPNGCARTIPDGTLLGDLISSNPEEYLGSNVFHRFHRDRHLPFLFKVLSFDKALPLQAHPDRSLGAKLMEQEKNEKGKNETFVDPNHKPEVAVTLSDMFEGFVGFRPIQEIQGFLTDVPELREAINDDEAVDALIKAPAEGKQVQERLKRVFSLLMHRDQAPIAKVAEKLVKRVEQDGDSVLGVMGDKQRLGEIVMKIHSTYPGDIGLFAAIFFMNFCRLPRGEGIAVPADCIHAYLEGDVVETMAWSDSMIATGFEDEKDRNDPKTFIDMLLYQTFPSKKLELQRQTWSKSTHQHTQLYKVPMDEFDLLNTHLLAGMVEVIEEGIGGPTVFVVTHGTVRLSGLDAHSQTEQLTRGQVVYVKPNIGFKFTAVDGAAEIWGSFVE